MVSSLQAFSQDNLDLLSIYFSNSRGLAALIRPQLDTMRQVAINMENTRDILALDAIHALVCCPLPLTSFIKSDLSPAEQQWAAQSDV
jgi:hypothetical protein